MSLEELARIDVTTQAKSPTQGFQTPAAAFVITSEDIRRSGATTIPEVLRMAPGVQVARIDGSKWSVGIRGFGSRLSRSVLVLIDGRSVYTTFSAGTYWEVQDTLLDDIERIEVIRGPGGTIWGPNAVNGVINIVTKSARATHGTLAYAQGGNEEQGAGGFRYGGARGTNLDYRIYGKGFTRSPERHSDGRNFDDWRGAQTGFRLDWNRQTRDTFTLQGDLYSQESGQSVQATSYTAPFSRIVDSNAQLSGGNVQGRWERQLAGGDDLQVQIYYDRTNRSEANFAENRDTFDFDFLHRRHLAWRQTASWGLGVRLSAGRAEDVISGLTFDPLHRTDQLYTAFVQDEVELAPQKLWLTVGAKLLRTNFTGFAVEPSARLTWTPDPGQTIWAGFTHAVRTPSRVERDFNLSGYIRTTDAGVPFFARFNANREFQPEQMNGYEVGYRKLVSTTLSIDFATYFNHYHGLLSQEITGAPFLESTPAPPHLLLPAQFGNGLRGATAGGEIAPEWRPTHSWRLRGSYSYSHLDLRKLPQGTDAGSVPGLEGSSPQHQALLQSSFDLARNLELDMSWRYVSGLAGQGVPAYSTGDARLGWRVGEGFEFALVGQNLLQPFHPEAAGDPGPLVGLRRSAYARLTWRK